VECHVIETVDNKRAIYRTCPSCGCVLVIRQDRFEIRVDLRSDAGWSERTLTDPGAELVLADFGLRCTVADVYRGTSLLPGPMLRADS